MLSLNSNPIEYIIFNGGEVQVNIKNVSLDAIKNNDIYIRAHLKSSNDIIALMQLKAIVDKFKPSSTTLELPRVPYAQSDRAMTQHECSGLKVFSRILNGLNFNTVIVDDPHSDVTEALIDNLKIRTQDVLVASMFSNIDKKFDCVISPDGGALKKIYKCAKVLSLPVIEASKSRDVSTGQITSTTINAKLEDLEGRSVLICDDIIDNGRTFIELAKILKEDYKVSNVSLYVTHGLFSKGFDLPYIDHYYVTNLWINNPSLEIPSFITYKGTF